jgi:hypothetical protein
LWDLAAIDLETVKPPVFMFRRVEPQRDAAEPSQAYGLVHDAFAAAGISLEQTPALLILKMSDPFIRALRRIFAKAKSVEGTRLGGQLIGDRFVGDALVYRVR